MAVYGPLAPDHRLREGVPNLRRVTILHPHLPHQSVEEVFLLGVETGLEHALELIHHRRDQREVEFGQGDLG